MTLRQRLAASAHLIGGASALLATALAWRQLAQTARQITISQTPARDSGPPASASPCVQIIVPARNEEGNIVRCLVSLSQQQLAPLRIWVVDDGSTDDTAALVSALAERDPRIRLIAGRPCPADWAGKNWALHQGISAALAAFPLHPNHWLLLTDADTWHHPTLLARAYQHALQRELQVVSVAPQMHEPDRGAILLRGAIGEFYSFFYGLRAPGQTAGEAAYAFGQCILLQTSRYQASGGFDHPALRSALDDDRALATHLQRSGGKIGALILPGTLVARGYASLFAAWQGHLHHLAPAFATAQQARHAFAALALFNLATLWPVLGALQAVGSMRRPRAGLPWLALTRWLMQLGALTALRWRAARLASLPRWYPFVAPLGGVVVQALALHALWMRVSGRGALRWKGRRYLTAPHARR